MNNDDYVFAFTLDRVDASKTYVFKNVNDPTMFKVEFPNSGNDWTEYLQGQMDQGNIKKN